VGRSTEKGAKESETTSAIDHIAIDPVSMQWHIKTPVSNNTLPTVFFYLLSSLFQSFEAQKLI